jgi:hypothetical protein
MRNLHRQRCVSCQYQQCCLAAEWTGRHTLVGVYVPVGGYVGVYVTGPGPGLQQQLSGVLCNNHWRAAH